jgi:hypothetical protein
VLRPDATRRLTCDSVVVELRGFEPLTPCMPCNPHQSTRPSAAPLHTTSALLSRAAGRGAVMRREATCGSVADNLLTARTCRRKEVRRHAERHPRARTSHYHHSPSAVAVCAEVDMHPLGLA